MRALSTAEVAELEEMNGEGPDIAVPHGYEPPGELLRKGLVKSYIGEIPSLGPGEKMIFEITARGQLALRVHRAYLASIGGAA